MTQRPGPHLNRHLLRHRTTDANQCQAMRNGAIRCSMTQMTQMTQTPEKVGTQTVTDHAGVARIAEKCLEVWPQTSQGGPGRYTFNEEDQNGEPLQETGHRERPK